VNKELLVSIITPSFNQASYLEETILSVINQEYKNIEYIIIDGGSEDGSVDIIKKYEKHISYWISEKDKGQADAINKGFAKCTGDFVCWINSDDILYSCFAERMVSTFKKNPSVEFIYGDVEQGIDFKNRSLRKGRRVTARQVIRDIDVPIPQQATMWKASILKKTGGLDTRWNVLLDRDFFSRIVLNCKIMYIPETLAFFRNHNKSKSVAQEMEWVEELPVYYEEIYTKDLVPRTYRKYRNQTMINTWLMCSSICSSQKEIFLAETFLKKARELNYFLFRYISLKNSYIKPVLYKLFFW
jgi:glycosyltransferase involved in cell wall biosynthesis